MNTNSNRKKFEYTERKWKVYYLTWDDRDNGKVPALGPFPFDNSVVCGSTSERALEFEKGERLGTPFYTDIEKLSAGVPELENKAILDLGTLMADWNDHKTGALVMGVMVDNPIIKGKPNMEARIAYLVEVQ